MLSGNIVNNTMQGASLRSRLLKKKNEVEPEIKMVGKTKILFCYYNKDLRDWNEAIQRAKAKYNIKESATITIICRPERK
jgi:hypothetical protein